MIVLITGATHTGKTSLAQKLLEEKSWPYLSIDHLKMGLIRSKSTDLTVSDDDALTNLMWPIVREIIKTAIENKQNLIIEGCYIPFDWKYDFDKEYLVAIKFICLCMSVDYIDCYFDIIKKHSSDIESRLDDTDCTKEKLINDNLYYINGCKHNNLLYALIEANYQMSIESILHNFL